MVELKISGKMHYNYLASDTDEIARDLQCALKNSCNSRFEVIVMETKNPYKKILKAYKITPAKIEEFQVRVKKVQWWKKLFKFLFSRKAK